MTLKVPSADEIRALARMNHFELSDSEAAAFDTLARSMFVTLEALDNAPENLPPIRYRERDPGARPAPANDPYNAIARRCSVKGAKSGKLAGKRIGLKDNICVAGVPMTCSSRVLEGYVPDIDATIVTRILDAGGEITAILNMDNFAFSGGGHTCAWGRTLNPHNRDHLTGGSSSGSAAALYYDDIDLTVGGDQGGSIRVPSSWCGVVGLKPTHGLVPYTGIIGIDATFDHAGPMGRTAADTALLLEVIAGKDPLDPRQGEVPVQPYTQALGKSIRGIRLGVLREGFGQAGSEPDVDLKVREAITALAGLGAEVREVSMPQHLEGGGMVWALIVEGMAALVYGNGLGHHWKGLYNSSLATRLGQSLVEHAQDLPLQLKFTLTLGSYLNRNYHGRLYAKAQNQRRALTAAYDRLLEDVDVLVMPTTPMKAHRYNPGMTPFEYISSGWDMLGNTANFNMTGHPGLNVPCARSAGLPVGMMLVGRHFDDATLLRLAYALEQENP